MPTIKGIVILHMFASWQILPWPYFFYDFMTSAILCTMYIYSCAPWGVGIAHIHHASCCLFAIVCRFKMPLDTTWCVWVHADIDLKTSMLSSCRFWWVWVTSFWRFYNYLLAISSSFVLRFLSLPSLCLYLIVPPMKLKRQRKIYQK